MFYGWFCHFGQNEFKRAKVKVTPRQEVKKRRHTWHRLLAVEFYVESELFLHTKPRSVSQDHINNKYTVSLCTLY